MLTLLRVLGFVVGAGLIFVGGNLWMISNDGVGGETSMKLVAGGLVLVGGLLMVSAVLSGRGRGDTDQEPRG